MLLIREGTWKVINEAKPQTPDANWFSLYENAQSTIYLSVENNQIIQTCNCSTAKERLKMLQNENEKANSTNRLYLLL